MQCFAENARLTKQTWSIYATICLNTAAVLAVFVLVWSLLQNVLGRVCLWLYPPMNSRLTNSPSYLERCSCLNLFVRCPERCMHTGEYVCLLYRMLQVDWCLTAATEILCQVDTRMWHICHQKLISPLSGIIIIIIIIIIIKNPGTSFPECQKLSKCSVMSGMVTTGTQKLSTSWPGTRR